MTIILQYCGNFLKRGLSITLCNISCIKIIVIDTIWRIKENSLAKQNRPVCLIQKDFINLELFSLQNFSTDRIHLRQVFCELFAFQALHEYGIVFGNRADHFG